MNDNRFCIFTERENDEEERKKNMETKWRHTIEIRDKVWWFELVDLLKKHLSIPAFVRSKVVSNFSLWPN